MATFFKTSPLHIAMESLRIRKNYMELEVGYKAATVLIKPSAYLAE